MFLFGLGKCEQCGTIKKSLRLVQLRWSEFGNAYREEGQWVCRECREGLRGKFRYATREGVSP